MQSGNKLYSVLKKQQFVMFAPRFWIWLKLEICEPANGAKIKKFWMNGLFYSAHALSIFDHNWWDGKIVDSIELVRAKTTWVIFLAMFYFLAGLTRESNKLRIKSCKKLGEWARKQKIAKKMDWYGSWPSSVTVCLGFCSLQLLPTSCRWKWTRLFFLSLVQLFD